MFTAVLRHARYKPHCEYIVIKIQVHSTLYDSHKASRNTS